MDPKGIMNHLFSIIWITGAILIIAGGAFLHGYTDSPNHAFGEDMSAVIAVGVLWPIILAIGAAILIIAGPLWLLCKLGSLARRLTR